VDAKRNLSALRLHIVPFFGHRLLRSLRKEDGVDYIAHRRQQGAAEGTIEREWAALMAVLNSAVDNEYLDRNRLRSIPSPRGDRRERPATGEELDRLCAVGAQGRNGRDWEVYADVMRAAEVGLNTGLRESKILAIDVRDCVRES